MTKQSKFSWDLTQVLFKLILLSLFIGSCLYIALPFSNGLAWSTLIVITTWPLLLKLQHILWKSRLLATLVMLFFIVILCVLPLELIISNLIKTLSNLIKQLPELFNWLKNSPSPPELNQLKSIPIIGDTLFQSWQKIHSQDSLALLQNLKPYASKAISWLFVQLANVSHFFVDAIFMIIFSTAFYLRGEVLIEIVQKIVTRLSPTHGHYALNLAVKTVRAVAIGIVVTAFVQAMLAGAVFLLIKLPFSDIFILLVFISCLIQIGAFIVLIPCALWFYWQNQLWIAIILLILTITLSIIDSALRPILISKGAKLPFALILMGVLGGLLAFGLIGLFVGPVLLAVSYKLLIMWADESATP